MDILVYTRNSTIAEHGDVFRERFDADDEFVRFRNADAHRPFDFEAADLVLVDDTFPRIAQEYRTREVPPRVETFDVGELGAPGPPEPAGPSVDLDPDDFASPTAHDAAVRGGLGPSDLEGVEPRGKTGYTTAQVRELVGSD